MNTEVHISIHETDPVLWDALSQVFPILKGGENDATNWVTFVTKQDVKLTFFKATRPVLAQVEEA